MLSLRVNRKTYNVDVEPETPLLWVIRDTIGLTGTRGSFWGPRAPIPGWFFGSRTMGCILASARTLDPEPRRQTMKKLAATILFVLLINRAQAQKLEWTNPDGLGKNPAYSQLVRAGKLLFIAGQTGVTADGKVVGPGMKQQYEQALNNLVTALKSQGTDLAHVAKITTYVTAMDEFRTPEMVDLRVKRFGSHPPASTLVQVVRLADPAYKVEVDAIAVVP